MAEDVGVWVYAVAGSMAPQWISGVSGVAAQPVRVVTGGGLSAAVTTVSLAEFGEEALRHQMEDLAWLETVARLHHKVIEVVAHHVPVVPMRLATVYRGDTRVAAMLAERHDDLVDALSRVTHRTEWGVKVSAASTGATAESTGDDAGAVTGGGPGAAFLRRRRSQLAAADNARRGAVASAERIHASLCRLAVAFSARAPQDPQLSGQAARMILNGAYLVDDGEAADFSAAVSDLRNQHPNVRIELTGPWPPYSFAYVEQRDAAIGEPGAAS